MILIVLANKEVPTHEYDGSLVMCNLMNAAESLGAAAQLAHMYHGKYLAIINKV